MDGILRLSMQVASFLVFRTVLLQLVEQSRFEKYIRIFSGFLLILLLVSVVFSYRGGEDVLEQVERQVSYRLAASDFRLQLRQAEEGRTEEIRKAAEGRILAEAESVLAEERFFLREGKVEFAEDESIRQLSLTVSRVCQTEPPETGLQEMESWEAGLRQADRQESSSQESSSQESSSRENGSEDGSAGNVKNIRIEPVESVELVRMPDGATGELQGKGSIPETSGNAENEKEENAVGGEGYREKSYLTEKVEGRLGISREKVSLTIAE